MELTLKGKRLGRGFRKQAERSLRNLQAVLSRPSFGSYRKDYLEANHQANMAMLSLIAAVLGYIDPEYKSDEESKPFSRPND